jgi:hypothetical protein
MKATTSTSCITKIVLEHSEKSEAVTFLCYGMLPSLLRPLSMSFRGRRRVWGNYRHNCSACFNTGLKSDEKNSRTACTGMFHSYGMPPAQMYSLLPQERLHLSHTMKFRSEREGRLLSRRCVKQLTTHHRLTRLG